MFIPPQRVFVVCACVIAFVTLLPVPHAVAQVEHTLPVFLADYEGRQPFLVTPAEDPPLKGKPVGWAAQLGRYDVAVAAVAPKPGMVIADIGCGKGPHALMMAPLVGPETTLYCRDTNDRHLATLRATASDAGIDNLDIRKSLKDNVAIAPESLDVALLADVYQYIMVQKSTHEGFMDSLWDAMKPRGVVIIAYQKSSHLFKPDETQRVYEQTMTDFLERGYEPGARWELHFDEKRPVHLLEFRKPETVEEPTTQPADKDDAPDAVSS